MSIVAPEQLAAVGVAASEAAEGLVAVEAGVEAVKVAVSGAGAALLSRMQVGLVRLSKHAPAAHAWSSVLRASCCVTGPATL